jgi:hypothetical protein
MAHSYQTSVDFQQFKCPYNPEEPITVVALCKAWNVFALSNTGIVGSNPTQGIDVYQCLFCVYVAVVALGGLISRPRRPTDCLWIKKLKLNEAFHGCPMLQVGAKGKREREIAHKMELLITTPVRISDLTENVRFRVNKRCTSRLEFIRTLSHNSSSVRYFTTGIMNVVRWTW